MRSLLSATFRLLNRRIDWYRLPFALSVMNLLSLQRDLRRGNLFGGLRAGHELRCHPAADQRLVVVVVGADAVAGQQLRLPDNVGELPRYADVALSIHAVTSALQPDGELPVAGKPRPAGRPT